MKKTPNTFTRKPSIIKIEKILDFLSDKSACADEICSALFMSKNCCNLYIRMLRKKRMVYVARRGKANQRPHAMPCNFYGRVRHIKTRAVVDQPAK